MEGLGKEKREEAKVLLFVGATNEAWSLDSDRGSHTLRRPDPDDVARFSKKAHTASWWSLVATLSGLTGADPADSIFCPLPQGFLLKMTANIDPH